MAYQDIDPLTQRSYERSGGVSSLLPPSGYDASGQQDNRAMLAQKEREAVAVQSELEVQRQRVESLGKPTTSGFGFGSSGYKEQFDQSNFEKQKLATLEQRLKDTLGSTKYLSDQVAGESRAGSLAQAQALQGQLLDLNKSAQDAINKQLSGLLEETGFQANFAREQFGAQAAGSGLGRSSYAQRGLQDITGAELGSRIEARQGAEEARQRVGGTLEKTRTALETQKKAIEMEKDLTRLRTYEEMRFTLDEEDIQKQLRDEMLKMQLDAKNSNIFGTILGGLLTGGVALMTGGASLLPTVVAGGAAAIKK